ncbi:MAG: PHB depolymerase family esterase [Candidatus Competibacter sp.]|nr:PHB depolymerase family esterase [Candidatus Competibacteraceae bacterium]
MFKSSQSLARALGLGLLALAAAPAWSGTSAEVAEFGPNPGRLRMFQYRPDTPRAPAPLVVALHGCQQTALDYARQAGWMQQADRWGLVLLLPEQQEANNGQRCFNWFQPESIGRDRGEVGSIRQMIARMQADHAIDPQRIYVTGLSAGGAMTAVLLAVYPELFAGGGIVAGIPYGCASGLISGLRCQFWGRDLEPAQWAAPIRETVAETGVKPHGWPVVSIWQGDSDWVVDADNAGELVEQWTALQGIDLSSGVEEAGPDYSHRVYRDAAGQPRVEFYSIKGMGHGQPIDPGPGPAQCGIPADYVLPVGICASYRIVQFWGLAP